jgi:hypothetical protein
MPSRAATTDGVSANQVLWTWATSGRARRAAARSRRAAAGFQGEASMAAAVGPAPWGFSATYGITWWPAWVSRAASARATASSPPSYR